MMLKVPDNAVALAERFHHAFTGRGGWPRSTKLLIVVRVPSDPDAFYTVGDDDPRQVASLLVKASATNETPSTTDQGEVAREAAMLIADLRDAIQDLQACNHPAHVDVLRGLAVKLVEVLHG